ncbi:MAG: ABC transporter substrate-binding protein [Bacteroidales bacterium]|nr:ABC transporter substrate-binding protein [Bacteroidales bacterium]
MDLQVFTNSENAYAQLFALSDSGSYIRLDIRSPWQGGSEVIYTYYLVKDNTELPDVIPEDKIITIPVSSSVCMSTSHVAMINALGEANGIVGVSGAAYISNATVREGIERGEVKDIGYDSNLNNELISRLEPDLVFVYGIGAESAGYIAKLREAGVNTLYICDYMELHPLARTEWIKLFGALYDKEEQANRIFDSISNNYESTYRLIQEKLIVRPRVMLGLPYKDKWFVSPGNSYISKLIADAGGEYIWHDKEANESMPLSIESVYLKGMESEFWLNTGIAESVKELLGVDGRFADLPPVDNGKLYNNTGRLNSSGGNDYWESGVLYPDQILKDLAYILQPELIGNHTLRYYRKLK